MATHLKNHRRISDGGCQMELSIITFTNNVTLNALCLGHNPTYQTRSAPILNTSSNPATKQTSNRKPSP